MNAPISFLLRLASILLFTLLAACGNSAPSSNNKPPLMTLPAELAAEVAHLTGTYAVYSESGTQLFNGDLIFTDDGAGNVVVSTPALTVERNTAYRFVIVFYWDGLAIAYIDSTQITDNDEATEIIFPPESLVYGVPADLSASESSELAANISAGILPDLDSDDDGYSNFIEVRSGTDPRDANSIPNGPTISNFNATLSADGNVVTITATLSDGNGVSDVALSFPEAAYLSNVLTTTVSGNEGDDLRTVSATFNPQYAPLGDLTIQLSATDDLAMEAEATLTTPIVHNGSNVGPVIDFESPTTTGAVLSGTATISVRAYDATDGISTLTLTQPSYLTDLSASADLFTAAWNTLTITDNTSTTLTARAVDNLGAVTTKSITVTISNGTDLSGPTITITVDGQAYTTLSTVSGTINFQVDATDATGVASLSLTNKKTLTGLTLTEELTTVISGSIDTTQYARGPSITLNFSARDTHGYPSTTSFTLSVDNDVDIDGSLIGTDCDDSNPLIYPGAPELLDGILNDCNGTIDNIDLADADAKFTGEATQINAGRSVVNLGDIDNDGYEDLLIGADQESSTSDTRGRVYLVYGKANATSLNLANADATFIGENNGEYVGQSIAAAGDVNGDGCDDILIGSQVNDQFATNAGKTYLIYGSVSRFLGTKNLSAVGVSISGVTFLGEQAASLSGNSVSGAGDVDADGFDDILIGAEDFNGGTGKVYLIYGAVTLSVNYNLSTVGASLSGATFTGELNSLAGNIVANAGDVNNDGIDDFLIGAYYYGGDLSGRTYLIFGISGPSKFIGTQYLSNVGLSSGGYINGATFTGATGDLSSLRIAGLGDTDGDGKDDIAISAGYVSNNLRAHIISGATISNGNYSLSSLLDDAVISSASTESSNDVFTFHGAGDVNGDGYNDLLMGDALANPKNQADTGETYLFYGGLRGIESQTTATANAIFSGEAAGDHSSESNTLLDFNGDGKSDIAIGALYQDESGDNSGAVYLIMSQY